MAVTAQRAPGIVRIVEGLYDGFEEIGRDELYGRLDDGRPGPDAMRYVTGLEEGEYTLAEFVEALDEEAQQADRTGGPGPAE